MQRELGETAKSPTVEPQAQAEQTVRTEKEVEDEGQNV